ncbi:hypothetical protein [Blastococcus sp. VKM Ac-2987]|uniref:hypothetical protein n=1 Tax=Blastococcus sp. VKM Ac-2987 TaxID=3004141 RepID=UPI0022AB9F8C|nr:hypothetical protein [Blastococcus sp. VKM Ac-2987]MCZ2858945.1 hypothetical protein [Blastococcus sp. VKM Ac-2987]
MAGAPLLLLLVLVTTVVVGAGLARRSPPSREHAVAAARRHATRTAAAAYVLGAAAAVVVLEAEVGNTAPGGLGVTVLLTLLTFGVVHVGVLALGELTWPRPAGDVRRARLVRRGLLHAAPRWLVRTAGGAAGLAVLTVVGGALLAAPDGRSVTYSVEAVSSARASPFPGLFYGGPAAGGLLALAVTVALTLWVVAQRPAVATEDERIEDALRRASAHRVLRVAAGVTLVVAGGLLLVGGTALHGLGTSSAGSGAWLDAWPAVAALAGLAAMVGGVVVTCWRAPGVPADRVPAAA